MERSFPFLEKRGFKIVEKLKGDASTREFYRVERKGETFVLMVFREEGLELQLRVHRFLSSIWPLPRIYDVFTRALLMEDAGEESLEDLWKRGRKIEPIYQELIGLISVLQTYGPQVFPTDHPVKKRALNKERFLKELNFTYQHFIKDRFSVQEEEWREASSQLVNSIDYSFTVPAHRDFHSRNIFLKRGRILILDYQDSMMGPPEYDYVSLLRDNYVFLEPTLRESLEADKKTFNYKLVSLQRHLKALGTFGFQIKRGKKYFENYLPITMKYLAQEAKDLELKMGLLVKRKILHRVYNY